MAKTMTFGRWWGSRSEKTVTVVSKTTLYRQAFSMMAHRWESDLLRTARRLCGTHHGGEDRARDLVQDALIRAYEAVLDGQYHGVLTTDEPELEEGRRQRAWLLRILTNVFINDYRRRRKWESNVSVDDLTADGASSAGNLRAAASDVPGDALLAETLDEPLEEALATLPYPMRLCVILVEIEGLEYAEAALILGIPIGTVRSRLSRARLLLQERLADYARERGWKYDNGRKQ
jgi:RNA polymerase sigma-70 factor, ECF subfamily